MANIRDINVSEYPFNKDGFRLAHLDRYARYIVKLSYFLDQVRVHIRDMGYNSNPSKTMTSRGRGNHVTLPMDAVYELHNQLATFIDIYEKFQLTNDVNLLLHDYDIEQEEEHPKPASVKTVEGERHGTPPRERGSAKKKAKL